MENNSLSEIFKYDSVYEKYADTYGQTDEEEPRFKVSRMYLDAIESAKTIFDAGVGKGGFFHLIQSRYACEGIEPSAVAIKKFHRNDVRIKNLFIQDIPGHYQENSFDVVVCLDVLEHIPEQDLDTVFHSLASIGKKYFIFSVANHDDEWDGMQLHVSRFSYTEWEKKLRKYFSILHFTPTHNDLARIFLLEKKEHSDNSLHLNFDKIPLVSVVVPSYNQAEWLPKTLDSIIAQTYPFWEAVVVNDGSTDSTKEIIERYEKLDPRIHGIHKINGGISSALNAGIENAQGKYFCWLSSDDLFYPTKLESQIAVFEKSDSNTAIVFGEFDHIDPKDVITPLVHEKPFLDGLEFPQFLKYDYIDGCTIMIPMEIMKAMEGFNVQFKHAQDTELWFRFAAKGYSFRYIPQKLTCRRIHPNQGFTDFGLDCRFDGFWMVDYYLSNYSFRDFYQHIDFSSDEGVELFTQQFYSMLPDPNCNINHPILFNTFWNWFTNGLKTLPIESRRKIISRGKDIFAIRKSQGKFFEQYLQQFNGLEKLVSKLKPSSFTRNLVFHDITRFDKTNDVSYAERLFEFGTQQLSFGNKGMAQNAFKYLSDTPNKFYENAFQKFYDLTFKEGNYDAYVRSFRRKPNIAKLPESVIASYAFAKIVLRHLPAEIDGLLGMISSERVRKNLRDFQNGNIPPLSVDSITRWNFSVVDYSIRHTVDIVCDQCHKEFSSGAVFELSPNPSHSVVACQHCYSVKKFSDELLPSYFLKENSTGKSSVKKKGNSLEIAIVMRYSNIIGGGVKKMLQHAEWLERLGCSVTIYSDSPAPTWRKVPGRFVRVKDHYEVPAEKFDGVVCMCIYDVPKMLTKYPADKVALFCQGYEGYHLGKTYDELRADKYFYTALHSLPAKKIVASKHLADFFEQKFGHQSYYVPNGINSSVYFPDLTVKKKPGSLLFIGNPNDPLKGLIFLTKTLEELQRSEFAIPGLTLHVVFGGVDKQEEKEIAMPGYAVRYHEGLSGKEVAALVNSVELVVNTSWYEGFSLPVLEAMACGTPVITTNNMGAESFCTDGRNGFVVKYGDMNRLGNLIYDVLNHKIDLHGQILGGLSTAEEYSEERSMIKFIESYSHFLNWKFPEQNIHRLIAESSASKRNIISTTGLDKQEPLFTVLVPTYNQAQFLYDSLNSLINQTYTNWEAVIVNDGSTDDTKNIVERFSLFDERIHVFHKQNGGVSTALNEALDHAKGSWICWLSSDDIFEPKKLEIHAKEFSKKPNARFFYTLYDGLNNATGQKIKLDKHFAHYMPAKEDQVISFFFSNYINGISICAHRSVFEEAGKFNVDYRNAQDFDMWLRISAHSPFEFISEKTCTYRIHPDQGINTFAEAGDYDSCVSCAEFLNAHSFDRIFPWLDLSQNNSLTNAIQKTLAVAVDPKSIINRLNFGFLLIDRLHEWLSQQCKPESREIIVRALQPALNELTASDISEKLTASLRVVSNSVTDNFVFHPVDIRMLAKQNIERKIFSAEIDEAIALRKYLDRIEKRIIDSDTSAPDVGEIMALFEHKKFSDVIVHIEQIDEQNQSDELSVIKGCAYLALQDLENAKASFENALKINPNSSEACTGLGEVFYLADYDKEAKTMFEWAVKNNPENVQSKNRLKEINRVLGYAEEHSSLTEMEVTA